MDLNDVPGGKSDEEDDEEEADEELELQRDMLALHQKKIEAEGGSKKDEGINDEVRRSPEGRAAQTEGAVLAARPPALTLRSWCCAGRASASPRRRPGRQALARDPRLRAPGRRGFQRRRG